MALTPPPFDKHLNQESDGSLDQQPGVLSQKADDLAGGFEKKAHNRAEEPGQQKRGFFADLFQTVPQSLARGFQSLG